MSSNAEASARWLTVHDEILRGITHALSNRIATVGAASYMYEQGDVPVAQVMDSLRIETERLEQLLQLMRLLPQRSDAEAEPVSANDAVTAAVNLHAHHTDLRDFVCDVRIDPDVYPLWIEPQALGHALLMVLTSAKRNAAAGSRIALRVSGDVNIVRFCAEPAHAVPHNESLDALDVLAANWLLAPFGGTARQVGQGCELAVPTLLAARRARKGGS